MSPVQVMIWDDHQGRCIGELSFRSQVRRQQHPRFMYSKTLKISTCVSSDKACAQYSAQVRAVRVRRDKVVVALEHKVLMYNFADLRLEHSTETLSNPSGLVALSPSPEHNVLACPGLHCGQVCRLRVTHAQIRALPTHAVYEQFLLKGTCCVRNVT